MKKMLICITSLTGGGAEKSLVNFIQQFKYKYDISLLVYSEKNNYYAQKLKDIKIDYFIKKDTPYFIEKLLNKVVKFFPRTLVYKFILNKTRFKKEKFDIEFAYIEGKPTKIISGSYNEDSLKLAYIHCDFSKNWYSRKSFRSIRDESVCYQKFHDILAVSLGQKESFEKIFPSCELDIVPNLIDQNEIERLSKESKVQKTFPYFCAVGRLAEVKNYSLLINAFHQFRKKYPEFHLLILGEGELRQTLQNQIEILGEQNYIQLVGFQSNPYSYIRQSKGLIQSSISESFSYVLAEASILGVPTISTRTQGSELMMKYFDVIEVDHDSAALAKGMEFILQKEIVGKNTDFNEEAINKFEAIFSKIKEK